MKRHLCITVVFALLLIPDWASAYWPRCGAPADVYYVPIYHGPVYCAPQPVYGQPIYVQPCAPMAPPLLLPPRVEPAKPRAGNSLTDPARPITQPTAPPRPPVVEPIRPAAGVEVPLTKPAPDKPKRGGLFEIPQDPTPDPKGPAVDLPKKADSIPPTTIPTAPDREPKLPSLDLPKVGEPKLPSLDLPKGPGAEPKLPPLALPKSTDPKLPSLDVPGASAVPVPAPAPDALVPSPGPLSPKTPDALPSLTLPPDAPVTPVLPMKPVEVKSSPLGGAARELKVSVFPASGAAAAPGAHKVGFYNHTGRDLALTVEGRSVTLPAMSYLHAQLPPTFTWTCAGRPAARATVPADATGLDVLIRE